VKTNKDEMSLRSVTICIACIEKAIKTVLIITYSQYIKRRFKMSQSHIKRIKISIEMRSITIKMKVENIIMTIMTMRTQRDVS